MIKTWLSCRGFMESLIIFMPMKRMPSPATICPQYRTDGLLINTTRATPTKASSGAMTPTSRAMSCPVMVVPMLAPMMIHTACRRVIMPEFTNPTTITVVAEEDWMTAVMPAPTSTPKMRLEVSRSKIRFIWLPAAASRPELIICMPYRKSARPPSSESAFVIVIFHFPFPVLPGAAAKKKARLAPAVKRQRCKPCFYLLFVKSTFPVFPANAPASACSMAISPRGFSVFPDRIIIKKDREDHKPFSLI